jgi:7-cyano-7-deazaguanine synthase
LSAQPADSALVLFSGGQDSTTCLAYALERYGHVETVGFDYRQRHRIELDQRVLVLERLRAEFPLWSPRLFDDHLVDAGVLAMLGTSALTEHRAIEMQQNGLPNTFVPGRNLLFLVLAAALADRRGLKAIIGGMCQTDFSGYPDCRDDAIKAMQVALNIGMAQQFQIETPLMWIDKAGTWALAEQLGGQALIDVIVEDTHTCYLGERGVLHAWGYGCGVCPACALRAAGHARWRGRLAADV